MNERIAGLLDSAQQCGFFAESFRLKVRPEIRLPETAVQTIKAPTDTREPLEELVIQLAGKIGKGGAIKAINQHFEECPEQQHDGEAAREAFWPVRWGNAGSLALNPYSLKDEKNRPRNRALSRLGDKMLDAIYHNNLWSVIESVPAHRTVCFPVEGIAFRAMNQAVPW